MAAAWLLLPSLSLPSSIPSTASFFSVFFISTIIALFISARRRRRLLPTNWPVIGMLPVVIANFHRIHDYITEATTETGYTFMFKGPWLLGMDYLVTADPANVHYIFNSNFANYPKGESFTEIFDVLGSSLFGADGESWKIQRRIAHGYLGDRKYRSFGVSTTNEKVEKRLLPLLGHMAVSGGEADLENVFMRLIFDITCFMSFGFDPGCLSVTLPNVPFATAIDDFWEAAAFRHAMPKIVWKMLRWVNLGSERKMARAHRVIDRCIAERIAIKRQERTKVIGSGEDPLKGVDALSFYMDLPFEDVAGFFESQDKFLRDTALFLMIAGRDALSIGLSWLFWLLSKNPRVEAKILDELRAHHGKREVGDSDTRPMVVFSEEELERMVYLHGATCEALRLYVPIPIEHKCALKADVLPSGHRVEAGTNILLSVYTMGRMEKIWGKDCMEFRPERWITEGGKVRQVPAHKFMVFNSGPRSCLGKDLVLLQLKAVAAAVLWNFEVEVVKEQVVVPKTSVMLRMKKGMKVRVRVREGGLGPVDATGLPSGRVHGPS